jgi:hypothetical protein
VVRDREPEGGVRVLTALQEDLLEVAQALTAHQEDLLEVAEARTEVRVVGADPRQAELPVAAPIGRSRSQTCPN